MRIPTKAANPQRDNGNVRTVRGSITKPTRSAPGLDHAKHVAHGHLAKTLHHAIARFRDAFEHHQAKPLQKLPTALPTVKLPNINLGDVGGHKTVAGNQRPRADVLTLPSKPSAPAPAPAPSTSGNVKNG